MASITFTNSGGINLTSGIQIPTDSGSSKSNNYISAGGGYSTNSGKDGVKIICCEQSDAVSGLGQDCSGLGGYDLSVIAPANPSGGSCFISFVKHSINSPKTYNTLGYFDGSGNLTASSFNATSSRTKKKNIEDCNLNAVELLNNVKIVNYVLKDDEDETPRIGFIAEDTDSLLSTPDHDHMDMGNCIGVLIKAMQEMSGKLKQSEEKIEELKLEIEELKKTSD